MNSSPFTRRLAANRVLLFSIALSIFMHVAVIYGYFREVLSSDAATLRRKEVLTANLLMTSTYARKQPSFLVDGSRSPHEGTQADRAEPAVRPVKEVSVEGRYPDAPIREQDYMSGDVVSERPLIVDPVDLAVPGVDLSGVSGVAELILLVSSSGRIDAIVIADSSLPEEVITHAVSQFMKARAKPGRINNTPVRSRMRIELFLANGERSGIRET